MSRSFSAPTYTSDNVIRLYPGVVTDAELVAALRSRRPNASAAVVNRYGAYVERLLTRVIGDHREVPDLLRDTFNRAIERIHDLRDVGMLKVWLGSMALGTAREFIGRHRFRRAWRRWTAPEGQTGQLAIHGSEHAFRRPLARTYALLDRLRVDERIAFTLRMMDGMELAEVAELCGVSLGTAYRRIARGQRRFEALASREPLLAELVVRRGRRAR